MNKKKKFSLLAAILAAASAAGYWFYIQNQEEIDGQITEYTFRIKDYIELM